ncbi:hypothetical protein [Streptomyces virginiae]|uniref:AbiJ-related protein n=1 Tax=Streptomyces virginiae TaxID=1961 RepID=UPI002DB92A8A|nr:hypothetical protein [Streptomyces sp. CMAA1738]MEC4575754.1 hypothetical protein [Streptomyces sp. CMAA1738]
MALPQEQRSTSRNRSVKAFAVSARLSRGPHSRPDMTPTAPPAQAGTGHGLSLDQQPPRPDQPLRLQEPGRLADRGVLRTARRLRGSHPRFGAFLEGLALAGLRPVLPDEPAQRRFVDLANRHLQPVGAVLSQEGEADGYPRSIWPRTAAAPRAGRTTSSSPPALRHRSAGAAPCARAARLVRPHRSGHAG